MIFHFQTGSVTFFEDDQAYYEEKFITLKKTLGAFVGDEDTVDVRITIDKNKHHAGDKFEASATVKAPGHNAFHAEVSGENIKQCADMLEDKIKTQVKKYHDKKMKH